MPRQLAFFAVARAATLQQGIILTCRLRAERAERLTRRAADRAVGVLIVGAYALEVFLDAVGRPERHALSGKPCRLPCHRHRLLAAKAEAVFGHERVRRAAAVNARLAAWLSEALRAGGHHDCVSLETLPSCLAALPHFTVVSVTLPSRRGVNHANVGQVMSYMRENTLIGG